MEEVAAYPHDGQALDVGITLVCRQYCISYAGGSGAIVGGRASLLFATCQLLMQASVHCNVHC